MNAAELQTVRSYVAGPSIADEIGIIGLVLRAKHDPELARALRDERVTWWSDHPHDDTSKIHIGVRHDRD